MCTDNNAIEKMDFPISKDCVIVTNTHIYSVDLLDSDFKKEPKEDVAYIDNGYYYVYRGNISSKSKSDKLKPGIYKNYPGKDPKYFVIKVSTDEEKEEYDVSKHAVSIIAQDIIDLTNEKEEILVAISESTKVFQPTLLQTDDILKRALKLLLLYKEVDLDRNKDQFKDKNALFNFKQVLKGNGKVSILIFNRGCDALKIGYKLYLYELDPEHPVGKALPNPICVDSNETYLI